MLYRQFNKIISYLRHNISYQVLRVFIAMFFLVTGNELYSFYFKTYSDAQLISVSELSLLCDTPANILYQPASFNEGISASYSNPYGFSEINLIQLSLQKIFKDYALGFGSYFYNNPNISDIQIYSSFAYKYQNLQAGFSLNYYQMKVKNYSSDRLLMLDLGLIWKHQNFKYAISYSNVTQSSMKGIEANSLIKFETTFEVNTYSDIGISFEKEKYFDYRYAIASSFKFYKNNKINMGFMPNPSQFTTGIEINLDNKSLIYSIRTHQELDLTHSITLKYLF
jgi:hypothetical protein